MKPFAAFIGAISGIALLHCIPRDNPYDPANPDFIIPQFSRAVYIVDDSTRGRVGGASIVYEYGNVIDSITTDTGGCAVLSVVYNIAGSGIIVHVRGIESATHRLTTPFDLTLYRDRQDTMVMLHDRRARPVAWDKLLTLPDSEGVRLVWHASDAEEFRYYRVMRMDGVSGTADTIEVSVDRNDTVFFDRNVDENELYRYRIDVISLDGIARNGDELYLAVPNRSPSPPKILEVKADFFIYLRIRWTMCNDSDFSRYVVYRGIDSVSFVPIFSNDQRNDTVWLDATIDTAANRYYYYLEIKDAGGLSSASAVVSGVNRTAIDSGRVYIRGGPFVMGRGGGNGIPLNQQPVRTVELSPYLIDRCEVTVERYVRFLNDGNDAYYCDSMASIGISRIGPLFSFDPSRANHPVSWVSWSDAESFCRWAGGHLPTEAQWEKAARGTDARLYPWGDDFYLHQVPPDFFLANYAVGLVTADDSGYSFDGARYTAPAGNYAAGISVWGVYDLSGNVSEWCNDWYAITVPADTTDPQGPELGLWRSYRGGSYKNYPEELTAASRFRFDPSSRRDDLGCRCVYDAH